jgi:hypothetical protein
LLQPRRDGLAEEAENEKFADGHAFALRHGALSAGRQPGSTHHCAAPEEDTSLPQPYQFSDPANSATAVA